MAPSSAYGLDHDCAFFPDMGICHGGVPSRSGHGHVRFVFHASMDSDQPNPHWNKTPPIAT